MNGEKEYTNDIRAICVIIIFFLNLFVRRKIYKNKKHKEGPHIQFIAYGLIKVLKYVVMCPGLVRFSDVGDEHA